MDLAVATTYDCDLGDPYGSFEVPFEVDVYEVPAKLPVGVPVDDEWDLENDLTLDELLVAMLYPEATSVSAVADDLGLGFGDSAVPVDLASGPEVLPIGDSVELLLEGSNDEFVPTRMGKQTLSLPTSFRLTLLDEDDEVLYSPTCTLSDPDDDLTLGTVDVVKQKPTIKGSAVKKTFTKGKRPKVLVSVLNQLDEGAAGDVVATWRGKTVGRRSLKNGSAKLRLTKLPVGTWTVTLAYQGSQTVAAAMKKVTVKVVRPNH